MKRGLVLVAEDSAVVRAVVRRQLEAHGFRVLEAVDGEEALCVARKEHPDVVLLDIEMPKLDGWGVLAQLKDDRELCNTPVVFVTGRTATDEVVEGLRMGAHDYLRKPFDDAELLARVTAAARVKALHDELADRALEYDRVSRLDSLTALHNRRHLDEHLRMHAASSKRHKQHLAVLMVDIDHFKSVNDRLGHAAGDEVLCEVSRRLGRSLRADDMAGRWGGEEFVLLLPHTDIDGALRAAERVRVAVAGAPVQLADQSLAVTISVGCASGVGEPADELLRRADLALYDAKEAGRNRSASR
ncbi:MAG TPA: diguanylate cyclase [Acidimicrobiales bacterium]|nr:diguanylate cyclase [Acidimicrobiales bacterium]